jgi:FkbM family methyltransferase
MADVQDIPTTPSAKSPAGATGLRGTLRYFSRFGLRTGLQVSRVHGRSARPIPVRLPELAHSLWLRPGSSDAATFDEVFVAREYDLPLSDFSPRHILDLGANVGYASVLFATRWPQASLLAVEPEAQNVTMLKRNTGPYRQINTLHAAVWARPAEVTVANPEDDANAFRMVESPGAGGAKVAAFTIPQLMERLGCEQVDLLKMDVEGAEAEILRDASGWIGRVNVLVVELHDRFVPGCGEALCAALHGKKFRQEIMGQNLVIDFRPPMPSRHA